MAYRPGYNNANQNQANQAEKIVDSKVKLLVEKYLEGKKNATLEYIGLFQGLPRGVVLYEKIGTASLRHLSYSTTRYGKNLIFISIADSDETFCRIISEEDFADNRFVEEDINLPSLAIELTDFITENDFDLSSIPDAYTFDLKDQRLSNKKICNKV